MRNQIIEYIRELNLDNFILTVELPRDESDVPLYIKNPKRIYVDLEDYSVDPIIQTLDGIIIENEITTVNVIFACDAKVLPTNYSDVLRLLRGIKNIPMPGRTSRTVEIERTFESDLLITDMTFTFTKLP